MGCRQQGKCKSLVADVLSAVQQLGAPQLRTMTLQLLFIWVSCGGAFAVAISSIT